jgi:hypothetical protein
MEFINSGPDSMIYLDGEGSTGTSFKALSSSGGGTILFVDHVSASVGILKTNPSTALDVNGVITASQTNIGTSNTLEASATYGSIIAGYQTKASRYGEVAHSNGGFAGVAGTAQHLILVARGLTLSGTFTVDIATAVFTRAGHSLKVGDSVTLSTTGTLPTGLNTTTTYYVISDSLTGSTFKLSTTAGGSSVSLSGTQSGTHSLISTTSLTLNGATGTTTPQLMTIPARSTWSFGVNISAYSSQNNQGGAWSARGGLRRNVNNINELETTLGNTFLDNAFVSSQVSIDADTINNALDIRVTGIANQSIRWCAVVDICQVSFGTP